MPLIESTPSEQEFLSGMPRAGLRVVRLVNLLYYDKFACTLFLSFASAMGQLCQFKIFHKLA